MVPPKGAYNVAVMFDRCRVTSCSCTCGAGAKWCTHVVALCLFRIHNVRPSQFILALPYTPFPSSLLHAWPQCEPLYLPSAHLPSFSSKTFPQMVLCSFRHLQSACGLQSQSPCLGYKGTNFKNLLSTLSVSSLSRWVRLGHLLTAGFQASSQPSSQLSCFTLTSLDSPVPCSLCLCPFTHRFSPQPSVF